MRCEEAKDELISCTTEDLQTHLSDRLHNHLKVCDQCKSLFIELQEMTEIWEQADVEPGLDLVTPVMNRLETSETNVKNIPRRPVYRAINHQVFHFGIAASVALFMFHFGIFEQSGWSILQTMDLVSHKIQDFAEYMTKLQTLKA